METLKISQVRGIDLKTLEDTLERIEKLKVERGALPEDSAITLPGDTIVHVGKGDEFLKDLGSIVTRMSNDQRELHTHYTIDDDGKCVDVLIDRFLFTFNDHVPEAVDVDTVHIPLTGIEVFVTGEDIQFIVTTNPYFTTSEFEQIQDMRGRLYSDELGLCPLGNVMTNGLTNALFNRYLGNDVCDEAKWTLKSLVERRGVQIDFLENTSGVLGFLELSSTVGLRHSTNITTDACSRLIKILSGTA